MRRREAVLFGIIGSTIALVAASCALNAGGIVYIVEDGGSAADGSSDVQLADSSNPETDGGGPIDDSGGSSVGCGNDQVVLDAGFCIDRFEVTNAKYAAFLSATAADAGKNFPGCATGHNLVPITDLFTQPNNPVRGVDWCAARAYCEWSGKRLCGAVQDGGGDVSHVAANVDYKDAAVDEWFFACSANGAQTYPYGSSYDGGLCNDTDYKEGGTVPVGSATGCIGGFPGIHDMAGNVWEWENSCVDDTTVNAQCRLRGNSFMGDINGTLCATELSFGRDAVNTDFGIRCCSDVH
ncbi:MAG: SUMF1/EgtB/PvdO family nonheme iron enzyme [Polyangiaceae bacterium]